MKDAAVMDLPDSEASSSGEFSELLFANQDGQQASGGVGFDDPQFQLRGLENNRLIDAATPLLGLVIRVRRLADFRDVESLYQQVVDDVAGVDRELIEQGYERPTVVAYRYVLCAFIDEAVLGTDWGAHSVWSQHSLLSRFHNETWGGEKVFAILARMEQEPAHYREMLAFIYLCLSLGFEGRYKVMENGREEYDQIVRGLYETLYEAPGGPEDDLERPALPDAMENVMPARNRLRSGLPMWGIAGLFVIAMAGVFTLYRVALDERIRDVLSVLDQLPK
ncbi:MAG: DotU family type IV/VI secretion system protein [Gammaproteobacteria bacterium]|nr:MAG: DotU family type IV/VI secretion system protein [Gammaproteobacteria bacterium]TNE96103.1 MAG: DotU family type IV/VI secretion system protein [Gammaproteobacteria bacterium]